MGEKGVALMGLGHGAMWRARAGGRGVAPRHRGPRKLTGLASAVGAGVFYLLESPTSPVPYATSRETPHEAGPLKAVLQGIPDILWPENKNPFAREGTYYEHKVRRSKGRKARRDRYLR